MSLIICQSESDAPPRELRWVGQEFYWLDSGRHVMWDGQDWVDAENELKE